MPDLVSRRFDWCLATVATALFLSSLRPATRASGEADGRALRWMLAGALLSLPLCLAGRVDVRSHTFIAPHIGIAAGVAMIALRGWDAARGRGPGSVASRSWIVLAGLALLLFHFALPVLQVATSRGAPPSVREAIERTKIDDSVVSLVVVRTRSPVTRGLFALYHPKKDLRAVWVLSDAAVPGSRCRVARTASDTLVLSTERGSLVPRGDFYRSDLAPLTRGRIDVGRLRVDVLEIDGLDVRRLAFRFDRPLDDPTLAFVVQRDGTFEPMELPAVGDSVVLTAR